jgi:putative ABC transport system permease protein
MGTVVAFVGISDGFTKSFMELYQNRGVDLIVTASSAGNPFSGSMPEEVGPKIAALDGVDQVGVGLVDIVNFENLGIYNKLIQGWPAGDFMFQELKPVTGERLSEKYRGKRGIMLGTDLAEQLKKKVGDKLTIFENEEFTVVCIFETFSPMERASMIMLLEDAQKLLGKKGITGCTVKVKPGVNAEDIRQAIQGPIALEFKLPGKIKAMPAHDLASSAMQLKMFRGMALVTSVIALIIGTLGILNTMVMSVFERTREIGILRAIGWRPGRIMRMILMESVLLSVSGGVVGTIGAILLTFFVSRLPQAGGTVRGGISATVIFLGFVIALLVGLIGAAYPAFRGARLMPTEAIRHE